jgi:hypothetical protein
LGERHDVQRVFRLLRELAKVDGIASFAKREMAAGECNLTEFEATKAWTERARLHYRQKGESDALAFSKLLAAEPLAGQHIRYCRDRGWIAKDDFIRPAPVATAEAAPRFAAKPVQVGGRDALAVDDPGAAMQVYNRLVAEIRAAHPTWPAGKVYEAAYTDSRHAEALGRERASHRAGEADLLERAERPHAWPRGSSPGRI